MKIIHLVLGKANPDRMNGVNKLVYEMAGTQNDLGYAVSLWGITPNPVHDYPERHFKTKLFQSLKNKTRIHHTLKEAVGQLPAGTIVHMHGSFIPEFYHVGNLLRKRRLPYVYTPHGALGPAALKRKAWKKKIYFTLWEKSLIGHAEVVIATGKSVYENVGKLLPGVPKKLIPNGQPLPEIDPPVFKGEKLAFGYCGRIALEHKGLDLLLKGFKRYLDKGGHAELRMIGDGVEMPILKQLAKELELGEQVVFYGAKFGSEKFQLLRRTQVFVHTSRMEGFPASVLEAASVGLPCLVSEATNVGEYIRKYDAGMVIESNTPEGISDSMLEVQRLFEKDLLGKRGKQARAMIAAEFNWKKICEKLIGVYEGAVLRTNKQMKV